jgi:hypothetical protein
MQEEKHSQKAKKKKKISTVKLTIKQCIERKSDINHQHSTKLVNTNTSKEPH